MKTFSGSCHCGAIQFDVTADERPEVEDCNCSICNKSGFLHLIVPKSRFILKKGEDHMHTYTFGSGIAQHYFCKTCGVKPFYIPRSNPDGVDVNARCLDNPPPMNIVQFDGQNWEENAHSLAHKSQPD